MYVHYIVIRTILFARVTCIESSTVVCPLTIHAFSPTKHTRVLFQTSSNTLVYSNSDDINMYNNTCNGNLRNIYKLICTR